MKNILTDNEKLLNEVRVLPNKKCKRVIIINDTGSQGELRVGFVTTDIPNILLKPKESTSLATDNLNNIKLQADGEVYMNYIAQK